MPSSSALFIDFTTILCSPIKAITFGITISPLKVSASSHTKSTCSVVPNTINIKTIILKGPNPFFPNKNLIFASAKKYHPIILENAKNSNAIATNTIPNLPNPSSKAF